jgi:hypothetical protein
VWRSYPPSFSPPPPPPPPPTGQLDGYYLLHATRADLLRRAGRGKEAVGSYRAALELAPTDAERRFLRGRLVHTSGVPSHEGIEATLEPSPAVICDDPENLGGGRRSRDR